MRAPLNVHKTVAGISRVALAICLTVLLIVFFTAYGVGKSTANPLKTRLLSKTEMKLEKTQAALATCEEKRKTHFNGDKLTVEDAVAVLENQKKVAENGIKMEKQRVADLRAIKQRCQDDVDALRKRAFGATAENITAHLSALEKKRAQLSVQHETLTNMKEMHRRSELIALQRALVQQLTELQAQAQDAARASACHDAPVKYSVVFDLGSSGNRVHVYKYSVTALAGKATTASPIAETTALPTTASSAPATTTAAPTTPGASTTLTTTTTAAAAAAAANTASPTSTAAGTAAEPMTSTTFLPVSSIANVVRARVFAQADGSAAAGAPPAPRDLMSEINLTEELFKVNYKALSKLPNPVAEAPAALRELFDQAKAFVPAAVHHCTPVEFKATAGLRMLGMDKAVEILAAIRQAYRNETFWMRGSAPVRILDGSEEGPMAWLTVNFLLGAFDKSSGTNSTVAVIDLGGGSTQVVFEPHEETFKTVPTHQQFTAELGSRPVRAYQHSYEGYGLHSATQALLYNIQGKRQTKPPGTTTTTATPNSPAGQSPRQDAQHADEHEETTTTAAPPLPPADLEAMEAFPCFAVGYADPLGVANTKTTADNQPVTQPDFAKCVELFRQRLLRPLDAPCPADGHCGIGTTYQPPLKNFPGDIYAFSFIFDLLEQANATSLAVSSEKFVMRLPQLAAVGQQRCAALTTQSIEATKQTSSLKPQYDCMYYAYVYALLRDGYGIPETRELHVAKKIKGYETAWTLGASLISLA